MHFSTSKIGNNSNIYTHKLAAAKLDMRLIKSLEYDLMPWKNGLGKTREIVSQLVGSDLVWRLSLAVVEGDGPFSSFDGFERILTVVRGEGMLLQGSEQEYEASPFLPVSFPGGEKVFGVCRSTPIENFNLIFNPDLVEAEVHILGASEIADFSGKASGITAVHVLNGQVACDGAHVLEAEDTGVCEGLLPQLTPSEHVRCAVVSLTHR